MADEIIENLVEVSPANQTNCDGKTMQLELICSKEPFQRLASYLKYRWPESQKEQWWDEIEGCIDECKKNLRCATNGCWSTESRPQLVCKVGGTPELSSLDPKDYLGFVAWPIELVCMPPAASGDAPNEPSELNRCVSKRIIRENAPDLPTLDAPVPWDQVVVIIISYSYQESDDSSATEEEAENIIWALKDVWEGHEHSLQIAHPKADQLPHDITKRAQIINLWSEKQLLAYNLQQARLVWFHQQKPHWLFPTLRLIPKDRSLIVHLLGRVQTEGFCLPFQNMPFLIWQAATASSDIGMRLVHLFYLSTVSGDNQQALSFFVDILQALPKLQAGIGLRWAFNRQCAMQIALHFYLHYCTSPPVTVALAMQRARYALYCLRNLPGLYYAWLAPVLVTFEHGP